MWFGEVLSIGFIVFSIFVAVNMWLLLGYIFFMMFDHMDGTMKYGMLVVICFSWPLFVGMSIARQLQHVKDDHDHAEG